MAMVRLSSLQPVPGTSGRGRPAMDDRTIGDARVLLGSVSIVSAASAPEGCSVG